MAIPKVFVSSTCYDLGQIRDSLSEFINSYYFDCMLSERGDIFYHPDLHTHESCLNEIENCQLFILIIGGRFGGTYKYDAKKSITNAEYEAARLQKIPVFTFIKKDLFDDHKLYQKNKQNKDVIKKIIFPSIENQDYAINIFEFINTVRQSEVNNGLFAFEYVKEIKYYLGKQWAGMMFNFLNERIRENNQAVFNRTLDNLTLINKKTEELVEGIIKKLNPSSGKKQIDELDKIFQGAKFYKHIIRMFHLNQFGDSNEKISEIEPNELQWYEYLANLSGFSVEKPTKNEIIGDDRYKTLLYIKHASVNSDYAVYWTAVSEINEYHPDEVTAVELYAGLKQLNRKERLKALEIITSANR